MMHAGLFDDRPRSRELIHIMLAQRAARALSGLMMHGHEYTIDEAAEFAAEWTPRGWMPPDSDTVWGEQHLYLQQPGYGTSYIIGKIEIEKLMAERALARADDFTIKGFLDEFRRRRRHSRLTRPMGADRRRQRDPADAPVADCWRRSGAVSRRAVRRGIGTGYSSRSAGHDRQPGGADGRQKPADQSHDEGVEDA